MDEPDNPPPGGRVLPFCKKPDEKKRYAPVFDEEAIAQLREAQARFQTTYCSSCREYDRHRSAYRETGHPNDTRDCRWHWTDIEGDCWNYRRERPDTIGKQLIDATPLPKSAPLTDDVPRGDTIGDFLNLLFRY